MIGDRWPSEMSTFIDKKTGAKITQLTNQGINFNLYFTETSLSPDGKSVYFVSNRACPETEQVQLFHINLEDGVITQLTDAVGGVYHVTNTPDCEYFAYAAEKDIHLLHLPTMEDKIIYTEKEKYLISMVSINCDKTRIGFMRVEDVDAIADGGPNYAGFKEKMFATKESRVYWMNLDGSDLKQVFRDTCWLQHFQFSPDDPKIAMFCHEGPWNYIQQRIWVIDMEKGEVWPCFRQVEEDCVGHEFWTQDGDIVFDNRRDGHDGTISNTKEQVYATHTESSGAIPYFGFAKKDGTVYRTIDMPYYCNHYYGNYDLSLFVGDATEDIVLIKPDETGKNPKIHILANHNTTWHYQRSHCHPTFSADGKKVIYAADTDRWHDNVFMVDVPEF